MTAIEIIISQLKEQIVKSAHHDAATIRTGDYRIGLNKAIQFCEAAKEIEKQPSCSGAVMPRISHFVSEIGQKYPANNEAVLIEIHDGYLRFYEIGYDFERIYLTPVYVAY